MAMRVISATRARPAFSSARLSLRSNVARSPFRSASTAEIAKQVSEEKTLGRRTDDEWQDAIDRARRRPVFNSWEAMKPHIFPFQIRNHNPYDVYKHLPKEKITGKFWEFDPAYSLRPAKDQTPAEGWLNPARITFNGRRSRYPVPPVADVAYDGAETMLYEDEKGNKVMSDASEGLTTLTWIEGKNRGLQIVLPHMSPTLEWVLPSPPSIHTFEESPIIKERATLEEMALAHFFGHWEESLAWVKENKPHEKAVIAELEDIVAFKHKQEKELRERFKKEGRSDSEADKVLADHYSATLNLQMALIMAEMKVTKPTFTD